LLYFESLAYRTRSESFTPCAAPDTGPAPACDIVIDLAGDADDSAVPTLRLVFDAGAGEAGLLNAVLASRWPGLSIVLTQAGVPPRIVRKA
ncbi:hypothetical protein LI003_22860, partial [Bacteroides caccae]|uniref:hypothetical protein n=1 Tax=Bacteroides caccae TaxID=47678 RepID=UPI001D08985C